MFKFSFDVDVQSDDEASQVQQLGSTTSTTTTAGKRAPGPSKDHTLAELISTLPDVISYSPFPHPLGARPLLRRDLYDARFQLALGTEDSAQTEGEGSEYVDADTDLIPGTYEGGLKSWEGGVDLVEVIARSVASKGRGKGKGKEEDEEAAVAAWVRGSSVVELGCGTGLPSAYLLRALLSSSPSSEGKTVIHVQDYNLPVLSLVTLPNLILAALPSLPLSARGAAEAAPLPRAPKNDDTILEEDEDADADADGEWEDDEDVKRPFDENRAGTLELTPALLDAFTSVLEERRVELRFTSGDWGGMAAGLEGGYKLVMSAETIYAEDSVGPLLDVIRAATANFVEKKEAKEEKEERLEDSLGALNVHDEWAGVRLAQGEAVILIAAKVLYFGVGGGLDAFLEQVRALGGWSTRVRDWVKGVGRAVVRIGW